MTRALLLGGTGLLGGAILDALLQAGVQVTALARRALPPRPGLEALVADRYDGPALVAALRGRRFDLSIDGLAFDAAQLDLWLDTPDFEPGRVVALSTGQVYLVTGRPPPFREPDAEAPPIPEPPAGTHAWHNWAYGMGKRAMEARLRDYERERGVPTLALRVPSVQGEADGRSSGRLWGWMARLRDGGPVLLPDSGEQKVRFVYVGDVAAAVVRLADPGCWPPAPAMNLAQPAEISLRGFLEQVAACMGARPRWVSVDGEALSAAGLSRDCAPYWGRFTSRPDPALALSLGFSTRGPADYLPAVVAAHLADPPPPPESYALRAAELALAARVGA